MVVVDPLLAGRLADVDARIDDAARRAGRDPGDVTRIVVTKFHPVSLIEELAVLGVRDVGENRQQELSGKVAELHSMREPPLRWHFIGQAQANKARAIRAAASVVHSIDRERIADAFDAAGQADGVDAAPLLDVLIQVNLTDDPARGGVRPDELEALATHVRGCRTLALRGVMAVAPLGEEPAAAFARLAGYSERLRTVAPDADWISAGMTADFPAAISYGATHLRIGSAITGPRPARD
ncbi:YggS family pyridoxal phosphate-dependent enzyme [Microbacterium rhizomatis]|uniref:Pyridoxal phosphate homeostasis protein n=1 Tax=Microbacterium rhizomatis TaxID=1631477 RepID=A0A5J5J4D0_9MICO|nr:YggS family pyridoxal phosphate-dependent enzyme [Microbacterium rhizomatis]KAA9110921.1 YggS family pyridoxal phosphate-dependent enzyme [Microbacterium rhizomatis]